MDDDSSDNCILSESNIKLLSRLYRHSCRRFLSARRVFLCLYADFCKMLCIIPISAYTEIRRLRKNC